MGECHLTQGRYHDAIKEYSAASKIYKEMNKRLEYATMNRKIAEAYVFLQEYDNALQHQRIHLGKEVLGNFLLCSCRNITLLSVAILLNYLSRVI